MPDIRKADAQARRRAVLLIFAAAFIGSLLILVFEHFRIPLEDWLLADPELSGERARRLLLALAGLLQLPALGFALYLWTLGKRICRAQEFPPPGLAVIRDTPVVTGTAAMARGRQLKLLAFGLVVASAVFGLLLWQLAEMFSIQGI